MNTVTETELPADLRALLPQLAAAWAVPALRAELLEVCRPERIEMARAVAAYNALDARLNAQPSGTESMDDIRAWRAAGERKMRAWGAWLRTQPPDADEEDEETDR